MIARHDRARPEAMSDSRKLPERVYPRRLAATGGTVEGEVPLAGLTRLADRLAAGGASDNERAALRLDFDEDSQRRIRITGRVRAKLELRCQCCLEPFEWTVDQPVELIAVADDEAAAGVPRAWEPVIVPPEGLDPTALTEDELILSLPLAPRCDRPECRRTATDGCDHGFSE